MASYADQNEASPSLKAASWEAERDGVMCKPERGFHVPWGCELRNCHHVRRLLGGPKECCHTQTKQNEASPSLGAAKCETVASFVSSCEAQRSGVIRKPEGGLAVPGGRELRNCRHVRGPLGGPAEWCHTQIRIQPRRPWGLRTAKLSPISVASGRPNGVGPHADQNEASPARKGLRTAKVSLRSWAPGRSGGVVLHADQNETSTSLGGCTQQDCRHFRGLLAGPAE